MVREQLGVLQERSAVSVGAHAKSAGSRCARHDAGVEARFQKKLLLSSACQPQVVLHLRGDDPCGSPTDTDVHFNEVSEALWIAQQRSRRPDGPPGTNACTQSSGRRLPGPAGPASSLWICDCRACQLHGATQISMRFDPSA